MGCGVLLSIVSITLLLVSILAMSKDLEAIVDTAWSSGSGDFGQWIGSTRPENQNEYEPNDVEVYIGLQNMVYCHSNQCKMIPYTECDTADFCDRSENGVCTKIFCDECHSAVNKADDLVLFVLLLAIPQLLFEVQRLMPRTDLNCSKVFGVFSSLLSCLCLLIALGFYEEGCAIHLPKKMTFNNYQYALDWDMGPGTVCLLIACFLKIYGVFVHIIIPTPVELHVVTYRMDQVNWKDDDAFGYNKDWEKPVRGGGNYHQFGKGDEILLDNRGK